MKLGPITLGPDVTAWQCLACGCEFAWHPANSGLERPSMCPNCDQTQRAKILRLMPDEPA
jgi:hypothetical protein